MNTKKSYASIFEKYTQGIIIEIEDKLERALSDTEKNSLYNAGSIMMLESLGMGIQKCNSKQILKDILNDFCIMANNRFKDVIENLEVNIPNKIGRKLKITEIDKLKSARNLHEMQLFLEKLMK